MKLSDQVVLITGSSRGLGLVIARAFHAEGAKIIINHFNTDSETVDRLAAEISAFAYRADVTDPDQVRSLFQAAESHYNHPVTTVVNNAIVGNFRFNGEGRPKVPELAWSDFDTQLRGFVQGALNTTQSALASFEKAQFGRIINIGSNLVQHPVVPYHDYTAAKGALLAFTRTLAADLGPKGVTCNMVSGGLLDKTDASAATPQAVFDQIAAATPLRKVTTPDDLAGAVLFFASPWARGITGQNLVVDGGLVMN